MNYKKISLFLLMVLSVFSSPSLIGREIASADLVKSILKKENINLNQMLINGHELLMGEVTGAGKKIHLEKIKVLVTLKNAYKMSAIQRVEFKKPGGLELQNIDFFEIRNEIVSVDDLQALIVKK